MGLGFRGTPDKLAEREHAVRKTAGAKNKIIRMGVEKIGKALLSPKVPDKVKNKLKSKSQKGIDKATAEGKADAEKLWQQAQGGTSPLDKIKGQTEINYDAKPPSESLGVTTVPNSMKRFSKENQESVLNSDLKFQKNLTELPIGIGQLKIGGTGIGNFNFLGGG